MKPASAGISPSLAAAGKAAVIGPGISIDGDISGSDNLVIEGKVKGQVQLGSHEVTIGQSGDVIANVTAQSIRVAGKVHGDLVAKERVVINSTGRVRGNIVTPRLLLEDGAIFKGSIDMEPGETGSVQAARPAAGTATKSGNSPEVVVSSTVKKNAEHALKTG